MATQTANVYTCTVYLASRLAGGFNRGETVPVIAQNPGSVPGVLQAQYAADLLRFDGPVQLVANAVTTMTGS